MSPHRTSSAISALLAMLTACLGAPARAAQGELMDIAWAADGRFGREVRVAPKKFVEVCGRLSAGTAVEWRFDAAARLDFNVHFHEGETVRYPARQAGVAKATGTLEAALDQDYCWMWSNRSADEVAMSFALRKR